MARALHPSLPMWFGGGGRLETKQNLFSTHPTPRTTLTGQCRALTVCEDVLFPSESPTCCQIHTISPCCYRGWQCPRISVENQYCTGQWWGCWHRKPQSVADGQHGGQSQSGGEAPWKLPGFDWWMYQGWNDRGRWWHQWQRQTSAQLSKTERRSMKVSHSIVFNWNHTVAQVTIKPQSWDCSPHGVSENPANLTLAHFRHLNTNVGARL